MELRHIRSFIALSGTLHFGRAARTLGISQPSLSHQLQRLEKHLKTSLVSRTKRHVQLTEAGRVFLGEARAVVTHADRAAAMASGATAGEIGRLIIGLGPWTDATAVLQAVHEFAKRYPQVHLEMRSMPVVVQINALRDERIDLGIVRPPINDPSIVSEHVLSEPLVVALPRQHRMTGQRSVALLKLATEPFVVCSREATQYCYDMTLDVCHDAGFAPIVRHDGDHPQTLLNLVGLGLGIALIPASHGLVERPDVVFRPLRQPSRRLETLLAWRRDCTSSTLRAFLAIARDVITASKVLPTRRAKGLRYTT
jgi:DNA-binding transcriptional LysR family regulator